MALNDRVEYISGDVAHNQLAPSQASRTEYYPGKASSRQGDMNFENDFRIPTGTPAFDGESAGPVKIERSRVVYLGRNVISDQTVLGKPAVTPDTTTIDDDATWGTAYDPDHDIEINELHEANGSLERRTGYDNIVSA